jgi:hypothetical protein
MHKSFFQSVAVLVGLGALLGSMGGCVTASTPQGTLLDMLNQVLQPTASSTTTASSQTGQTGLASEAEKLLKEIEKVLGGQNTGTSDLGANLFLAALAGLANTSQDSTATTQPAQSAHPFKQLRAEIHNLRHSTTPDQAALLLLSALNASLSTSNSLSTSTGASGPDPLSQAQNLLTTLHSLNPQSAATTGTATTP